MRVSVLLLLALTSCQSGVPQATLVYEQYRTVRPDRPTSAPPPPVAVPPVSLDKKFDKVQKAIDRGQDALKRREGEGAKSSGR